MTNIGEFLGCFDLATLQGDDASLAAERLISDASFVNLDQASREAVLRAICRRLIQVRVFDCPVYGLAHQSLDDETRVAIDWLRRAKHVLGQPKRVRPVPGDCFAFPVLTVGFFVAQYLGDGPTGPCISVSRSFAESCLPECTFTKPALIREVQVNLGYGIRNRIVKHLGRLPLSSDVSKEYIGWNGDPGNEVFFLVKGETHRRLGPTLDKRYQTLPPDVVYPIHLVDHMVRRALAGNEIPMPFYADPEAL